MDTWGVVLLVMFAFNSGVAVINGNWSALAGWFCAALEASRRFN